MIGKFEPKMEADGTLLSIMYDKFAAFRFGGIGGTTAVICTTIMVRASCLPSSPSAKRWKKIEFLMDEFKTLDLSAVIRLYFK